MKRLRSTLSATALAMLLATAPLSAIAWPGGGTESRNSGSGNGDQPTSPVPEPGALLLFAAGAVVVGAALRRKRH